MKKLLALLLATLLLFTFAACGSGNSDANDGGANDGVSNSSTTNDETSKDSGSKGDADYEAAVELFVKAKYGFASDKLVELVPEDFWKFYEQSGMPRSSLVNEAKYAVEQTKTYYSEPYGANFTLSVDIKSAEKVKDVESFAAVFEQQKGIKKADVKEIYDITATVNFNGTTKGSEEIQTKAVKIDKKWYCCGGEVMAEGGYIFFELENLPEYG